MPSSKDEGARRLQMLQQMFSAYHGADAEKIDWYLELTAGIPDAVFEQAIRNAAMAATHGFAPSVGEIITAARRLYPGYGDELPRPRWYERMRRAALPPRSFEQRRGMRALAEGLSDASSLLKPAGGDDKKLTMIEGGEG